MVPPGERVHLSRTGAVAGDVESRLRSLLGVPGRDGGPLGAGVVHTTSVWRDETGELHVLRIREETPKSENDRFLLGAARARAEVILLSGAILRAEPELRHELHDRPAVAAALAAWRRSLGSDVPPALAVLSRGDVDLGHPALRGASRVIVLTEPAAVPRLHADASALRRAGQTEIAGLDPCGARTAIGWLRERFDRLTVELGPSAARELYDEPVLVDELWLARYLGAPPASTIGSALFAERELLRRMALVETGGELVEASGRWRFERRRSAKSA